jgi:hypothetical protein
MCSCAQFNGKGFALSIFDLQQPSASEWVLNYEFTGRLRLLGFVEDALALGAEGRPGGRFGEARARSQQ